MITPVRVGVKIGVITKSSRTNTRVEDAEFPYNDQENSFAEFFANAEQRIAASLRQYDVKTNRHDTNIYMKPSQTAAQKDFIALNEENFATYVATARANYHKRKKMTGPFVIEIYGFAAKDSASSLPGMRRATAPRIHDAAGAIDAFLAQRPEIHVGEIARTHWSIVHARRPEGTPLEVPDSATFAQAQHLDAMASGMPAQDENVYQTISVRLNGSSDLQLTVNVRELRRILGLPSHNLLANGIFQSFVPPDEPEDDVEDVDHMSD